MCVRTILHHAMGKSSLAKVQYLHTNVTVLTAKYSSLGLSKLNFRFVEKFFSTKWKNFFKGLKIFENKERFVLGRRSITLKTHFATPCQAKNKNRLLGKKRSTDTPPTPGVGRKPAHSLHVTVNYRHLRKNKEDFWFFVNFGAGYSPSLF